ncbi:L-serine ammonia-lyase, iron-sulfur-dependent, subunit alpha [Thermosediminibacter oceani]|uniref:L-serine dehydratase n=1 Tax=Thermosediminibacter oceani (strain ATCC BAA-1034 / DSM 16646 / JW/IW-1228P) TaxID=555079 RepID=D9RYV8_THEOJ|nr:L-serine ammonia-lyase, iron-sulfur-dependent, subunit alpha [Thermosediminibacter oceani]ADL08532.1 L-serine ammonia-lyase [Thermosediminibacter oceani DSM 16646]
MIRSIEELVKSAEKRGCKISTVVRELEAKYTGSTEEELFKKMRSYFDVMKEAANRGVAAEIRSISGITGGEGRKMWNAAGSALAGSTVAKAAARAMAVSNVNASMGKIVAAPTAGSCGILPGSVLTVGEKLGKSDDEIVDSLFTAAAVGRIIALNATIAGAEGGCQAECGAASAMAAAAVVELAGGSPRQAAHAVAMALKAVMGLVCDPVAGLVEVPCIKRNAMGAAQAILAADMAMAGIESVIPADEVITAMKEVGRMMSDRLKETAMGGLAVTPTGKNLSEKI